MVTGDEEIKYGYLLDPCFQMVNTAGKPLTSGWIEVYIAGTRNKYYCSSDFAGTLHPFKIPLDSLGSNIILADVEKSYDVYVYNKFGNLAMSRYNITPGKGGAGGSISGSGIAEHWIGKNGQNTSVPAGSDTALKLPTNYEYEGSFIDRINENRTAFYLKEGLYLVQAVVNFKQSDQSLTNEISQVDVFTRSDDAHEDMSFNRDMAGPDSSDDSHCLKVSFIRCVKEDDEVSQIVLFKVKTPNAWSECYLQNVQIARLSSGGAGAGGPTYTAGDYISIENDTISVTGIEPESYATHDELQSATSAFITSADLPDLSGYATEQWVLDKHYITSADIPDIPDDLVTSAELAQTSGAIEKDISDLTSAISEALADKMDKSSSADFYPRYDNPEGYLTSVPSEYVTESEMSGYVQDHTSGFITSADLPDVSDMATQTWVTDQHYITSADVPHQVEYSAGDNIDITNHVVSVTETSQLIAGENVSITPSGNDYIISAQVTGTSGYVTEQEMNDAIQSATSAFITSADIPPLPEDLVTSGELATVSGEIVNQIPSLQGYATEEYVTEQTSAFLTSADLPDVSDMATQTWVGEQGYLTSVPSEYVTETELNSAVSGKADKSEIPSIQGLASETYVDEHIESATSGKADKSEIPSLDGYATETYVAEHTSAFITSAELPSEEEVEFEELDLSAYAMASAIPDVSNFVTQEDIDASVSGKMDATESSAFYPMATNPSGYLTSADVDMSAYIPYSAAGVDLPNSNFRIDSSGQAYKITVPPYQNVGIKITKDYYPFAEGDGGRVEIQEAITAGTYELRTSAPDALYISSQDLWFQKNLVNGVATFTINSDYPSGIIIGIYQDGGNYVSGANSSNTTLVKRVQEQTEEYLTTSDLNGYATESYVTSQTSGKQDALTFSYDSQSNITAIDGHGIAGGGGGGGVTEQYVQNAVASGTSGKLDTSAYTAPVNADWTSSTGLSKILNKPQATQLLAGTGISISESGANYVISSTAGSLVHDNTLSGYGTSTYPLGVVAQALYTAGILDVQYVNQLPASPTSGVLYLIPES